MAGADRRIRSRSRRGRAGTAAVSPFASGIITRHEWGRMGVADPLLKVTRRSHNVSLILGVLVVLGLDEPVAHQCSGRSLWNRLALGLAVLASTLSSIVACSRRQSREPVTAIAGVHQLAAMAEQNDHHLTICRPQWGGSLSVFATAKSRSRVKALWCGPSSHIPPSAYIQYL